MSIIGIDLGTTNSLACVWREGRAELIPNELGEYKTPSAVSLLEDGTVLVGAAAKERLISHPESTAASFKVWMGSAKPTTLGERSFLPEELSAFVLRQLLQDTRRYLNEPVEEAVISVPAYFNDDQRCATKLAAQLAGWTVKRLINEPSAAALYHRQSTGAADGQRMIVDFGGGTLDVSIVECFENIIEITAIAGDNRLGGDDIDRAIVEHFCQENGLSLETLEPSARSALCRQVETAKIALSAAGAAAITLQQGETQYSLLLTRALLRQLCQPVFQRVRAVISRALKDRGQIGRIDDVILVGGSAQLTVFGDFLEELFGRRPAVAAKPDEIVALGVGLCAGIKARAEDLQDLVMTDVCPFSLGVATYNNTHDSTPHMAFLISRSSMLPATHQGRFVTLHDNQQALRFEIYQGEGYFASENLKLGELEVQVPPGPAGSQSAQVTFTYDIDGILHVTARSSGGDLRDRLIVNSRLHLTQEEMKRALERIEQIQLAAQGTQQEQFLMEWALRLYKLAVGPQRTALAGLIEWFRAHMGHAGPSQRRKLYAKMEEELRQFEVDIQADPLEWGIWKDSDDLDDWDEADDDEDTDWED
ncbi:MAG: Hsp70 family protein [Lawsonibacter sp.]|nr:Hsp70 family protein [Lawsonibacter sp.]